MFEVCANDTEVVAWDGGAFEFRCQVLPDCDGIIGKVRENLGSYKLYFAGVTARLVSAQREVSRVTRALHGGRNYAGIRYFVP